MGTFRTANHIVIKQAGKQWGALNAESLKNVAEWSKQHGSAMDAQPTDDFVLAEDRLIDVSSGESTKIQNKDGCRLLRLKENWSQESHTEKAANVLLMN